MKIHGYGVSTVGRRQENEDALICRIFDPMQGCIHALAVVCDGMGGHYGGKIASRVGIEVVQRNIQSPPESDRDIEQWAARILDEIQEQLRAKVEEDPKLSEMGTTLVMGIFTDTSIWIVNIGDSRAYQIDGQGTHQITRDHTAVQDAIDRNLYTLEEIRENETLRRMTSALSRYLGPDSDSAAELFELPLRESQWFLFCSDGLTGNLAEILISEYEIWKQLSGHETLEDALQNLMSLAYQNGSTDNITVAVIELGDAPRTPKILPLQPKVETLLQEKHKTEPLRQRWTKRDQILLGMIGICMIALSFLILQFKEQHSPIEPDTVLSTPTHTILSPTRNPTPISKLIIGPTDSAVSPTRFREASPETRFLPSTPIQSPTETMDATIRKQTVPE